MRHLIIGNSAAGVSAAETIRRCDPVAEIAIVAAETSPAYSRCLLPNYLAGTRSEEQLNIRDQDFYTSLRIEPLFGRQVEHVLPEKHLIELTDKRRLGYDRLLIATGSRTFMPPIEGIDNPWVYGLRNLEDAKQILAKCESARRVVIIGGGLVGLETAYALYKRGLEVTVVEKMPQILPLQFDYTAASILQRDLQAEGIRVILGTGVQLIADSGVWAKLFGNSGSKGVVLENGERLKADVVVVATGTRTNVELLKNSGIKYNRGILVDQYLQTSVPGIYAAGDVVETADAVTGQVGLSPIWPNAVAQGRVAGANMAGQRQEYTSRICMQNAVQFRDVPAIAIGITNPTGDDDRTLVVRRLDHNIYKKLVLRGNILVGMILVGDIRQAGVLSALIRQRADVSCWEKLLLRDDFGYARILAGNKAQAV